MSSLSPRRSPLPILAALGAAAAGVVAALAPTPSFAQVSPTTAAYNDPDAAYSLGLDYEHRGRLSSALEQYNRALAMRPRFADALFSRGQVYARLKRYREAAADFRRVTELKPKFYDAYVARGQANRAAGEVAAAVADFTGAVAVRPGDPAAYAERARTLAASGDLDGALQDYNSIVRVKPDSPEGYYGRALTLAKLKRPGMPATPATETATASSFVLAPAASRDDQMHLTRVIADLDRASRLGGASADAYLRLAVACDEAGRAGEARDAYTAFLKKVGPFHPRAGWVRDRMKALATAK